MDQVNTAADLSKFAVGSVLGRTFSTFFKHPFVFWGLCALAQVPGFIFKRMDQRIGQIGLLIAGIISLLLTFSIQGAVAYGVFETLRGDAPRFGRSLSRGLSRFFALLGASFAMGVCFMLYAIVPLFIVSSLRYSRNMGMASVIIAAVVFLAFLVLFCRQWCKWSVFAPACAVERLGPLACLNRSAELTKGCHFKIGGLYTLCVLMLWIFAVAAVWITIASLPYLVRVFGPALVLANLYIREAFQDFFIVSVLTAFWHVMTSVIYYALRDAKEGVTLDSLAKVFD